MRRRLSSQLQRVQALLPAQRVLRSHFVRRLCGRDVDLGVLGGALSCQRHETVTLRRSSGGGKRSLLVLQVKQTYARLIGQRSACLKVTVNLCTAFFAHEKSVRGFSSRFSQQLGPVPTGSTPPPSGFPIRAPTP